MGWLTERCAATATPDLLTSLCLQHLCRTGKWIAQDRLQTSRAPANHGRVGNAGDGMTGKPSLLAAQARP